MRRPRLIRPLKQERAPKGALPASTPAAPADASKLIGAPGREEYETAVIRGAAYFRVTRGPRGGIEAVEVPGFRLACAAATIMGRGALIYAVNSAGRSTLAATNPGKGRIEYTPAGAAVFARD